MRIKKSKIQKQRLLQTTSGPLARDSAMRRKSSKSISINLSRAHSLNFDYESFTAPSYEEIISEIRSKIGEQPSIPDDLPRGVWSDQALKVLQERYLKKDEDGKVVETPEEMCWRVSWEIASAEARWGRDRKEVTQIAREFYNLLVTHEFLPNSPTLMNAGTGSGLQYSACFVLPVEDSMEGIFDALKYQAIIHKTGGGTGFAFSRLRPRGSRVRTSSGTASGPVSFMRIFDAATNEVKQGGKRRGANMGILRIDHPDILEFIHCKEDGGITNFNISVAVTDAFMEAYEKDSDYDLIDPRDGRRVARLSARKVFDEIVDAAWRTGDPGLIFIDKINRSKANPVPSLGPIESTNPCGEQPLYPFDACNLGSIFLNYFVKGVNGQAEVDWEKLKKTVRTSVRFLDDVIEVNPYPLKEIRKMVFAIRRIGLGVGGWADMLTELGIPYDSQEALDLGERVMRVIQEEAVEQTRELAKERGPFPMFGASIYKDEAPRRNSTVTTIAPTGSISIIADASSGIEPLFALAYQHIVKDKHLERTLTFINPRFERVMRLRGLWSEDIRQRVIEHGVIRDLQGIPEDIKMVFGTAHEIDYSWHIRMQEVFQKYTENAVSKTINMRREVAKEDVKKAYLLAWKLDLRGITVFRDGCKDTQVLNLGVKEADKKTAPADGEPTVQRPFVVSGATYKLNTPVGAAFITINQDYQGEPLEVFINVGKAGSDVTAMAEALGRTISTALRFRSNLKPRDKAKEIAYQLAGIGGRRSVGFGQKKILSLPDAVAAALSIHFDFKINGFNAGVFKNQELTVAKDAVGSLNGESKTSEVREVTGVPSDGAGAVVMARESGSVPDTHSWVDDYTMASVTSNETSAGLDLVESNSGFSYGERFGDICPSCGAGAFVFEEGCSKCLACGYSEC